MALRRLGPKTDVSDPQSIDSGEVKKAEVIPTRQVGTSGQSSMLPPALREVAQPRGPMQAPSHVEHNFNLEVRNDPPLSAGTRGEQLRQAAASMVFATYATQSLITGGRRPPDFAVGSKLARLDPMPPITSERVTTTAYTSRLPGGPDAAFEYFVNNPNEVFGAAGLKVRPGVDKLTDGARLFLEDKGPPPVWAPIEVRLDPIAREVRITTLDGHPLRGINRFQFSYAGPGETQLVQKSAFQGSSPLMHLGVHLFNAIDRQHDIWQSVHGHLHEAIKP